MLGVWLAARSQKSPLLAAWGAVAEAEWEEAVTRAWALVSGSGRYPMYLSGGVALCLAGLHSFLPVSLKQLGRLESSAARAARACMAPC